jgi:hypothetical protein
LFSLRSLALSPPVERKQAAAHSQGSPEGLPRYLPGSFPADYEKQAATLVLASTYSPEGMERKKDPALSCLFLFRKARPRYLPATCPDSLPWYLSGWPSFPVALSLLPWLPALSSY